MTPPTDPRSKKRIIGRTAAALLGLTVAYFLFYFLLFKPSLPPMDPEGERYLAKVKQEDWSGVTAMHASKSAGEEAVRRWKQIRKEFGPIRSVEHLGSQTVLFPLFTRGMMAYSVKTDNGELFTLLDLKGRWGYWKVRETQAKFQPPQPFTQGEP